jgi:hypothetical protein
MKEIKSKIKLYKNRRKMLVLFFLKIQNTVVLQIYLIIYNIYNILKLLESIKFYSN